MIWVWLEMVFPNGDVFGEDMIHDHPVDLGVHDIFRQTNINSYCIICIYIYMYIYMYIYIHTNHTEQINTHIYIYTYTYTYTLNP